MTDLPGLGAEIDAVLRSGGAHAPDVCAVTALSLPADGVAVTVMASDAERETVFASDEISARLERAQYSVGAGPSLSVFASGRPVMIPDATGSEVSARWPGFAERISGLPVGALFVFPLRFGVLNIGVCLLYRRKTGDPYPTQLSFVLQALDLTTLALLELRERAGGESVPGNWLATNGNGRNQVHQATGMLIAQLGVSAEAAFARLRGYAFAHDADLENVAAEVVHRHLQLDRDAP